MEFIIGFIMGLILAHITAYVMYENSLDEIKLEYERKINKVMEMFE